MPKKHDEEKANGKRNASRIFQLRKNEPKEKRKIALIFDRIAKEIFSVCFSSSEKMLRKSVFQRWKDFLERRFCFVEKKGKSLEENVFFSRLMKNEFEQDVRVIKPINNTLSELEQRRFFIIYRSTRLAENKTRRRPKKNQSNNFLDPTLNWNFVQIVARNRREERMFFV